MEALNGIPPQIPGYTFAQKLGSGSEANVYLYQQLSPSRQVAIKVSKGTLDPRAAARFRSEANFMGRISSHPYILSVYESGVTTTGNGYTVFEYAPGGNYKTFLESNRLNADQMLTVGINLASALSTAHREGIIHRDIKPSNILINTHGMPMLSDFGIAGTIYGRPGIGYTIAWAPPEVLAKNGGGNESSDIYSLGATLFAMLTGQSPYEYGYSAALGSTRGKERGALLRNIILTDPLPKLNRPDIPPQVERILRKALNKTPEDRYYSAYDFARDMQRAQRSCMAMPRRPRSKANRRSRKICTHSPRQAARQPRLSRNSATLGPSLLRLSFRRLPRSRPSRWCSRMRSCRIWIRLPTIAACRSRIRERTIRTTIRPIRPSPQVACPVSRIWPAHIPAMAAACSSHG